MVRKRRALLGAKMPFSLRHADWETMWRGGGVRCRAWTVVFGGQKWHHPGLTGLTGFLRELTWELGTLGPLESHSRIWAT